MTIDEAIKHARKKAECNKEAEAMFLRDDLIWNAKEERKLAEEHEQLAEWLEELKAYHEIGTVEECKDAVENIERFYQLGYNKAIDDFARQMEAEIESSAKFIREYDDSIAQKAYHKGLCQSLKIAEQLKVGGIDG